MPYPGWPEDRSPAWLANVGAPDAPVDWHVEGAVQFLEQVAAQIRSKPPRHKRARHLVALPIVGTGAGGKYEAAGGVIRALLPKLFSAADRFGYDIALVTKEATAFAAAQAERRHIAVSQPLWHDLGREPLNHAERLARDAAVGRLVLFLGSGVSAGAGLPLWADLISELADQAGIPKGQRAQLRRFNEMDMASLIERRFDRTQTRAASDQHRPLDAAIARRFDVRECALAHSLLAALPVRQVATTNYDRLFEVASESIAREVSVLPHAPRPSAYRWLLKMHGCVTRPHEIVLTREDYLRYETRRAALAGLVQALLLTQHILFVGFSLSDDNFIRIADAVRRAIRGDEAYPAGAAVEPFGTVTVLQRDQFLEDFWGNDFRWIAMDADGGQDVAELARRVDIFLDYLLSLTGAGAAHLLDERFAELLTDDDRQLRDAIQTFVRRLPKSARQAAAWVELERTLDALGMKSSESRPR
jgi:hypothetical protein